MTISSRTVVDMITKEERHSSKKVRKVKSSPRGKARGPGKRFFVPMMMLAIMLGSLVTAGTYYMTQHPAKNISGTFNDITNDSFGQDNLAAWNEYGQHVNTTTVVTIDPGFAKALPGDELARLAKEEGKQNFTENGPVSNNNNGPSGQLTDGSYGAESGAGAAPKATNAATSAAKSATSGASTQVKREVEEADMVKVINNRLYVLNSYRGLVVIDVSDPAKAHVTGRAPVLGYPVDMYVVDFLAIVTVRSDYGYWYKYWTVALEDGTSSQSSATGFVGTSIYLINCRDPSNPVILKIVELEGFASQSRRVGHVIYETTNIYSWYDSHPYSLVKVDTSQQEEQKEYTVVTSIDVGNPATLGMKDRVKFEGSSGMVYASPTAFYVAQSIYNEPPWYSVFYADSWDAEYSTKITYLDIRDPNGDIVTRDSIQIPGSVYDKYQMDEFDHMFRVVAHVWKNSGQESWLYIYNVTDPRDIKAIGKVRIDDTGNLMATRFAGNRAYTIHLPQTFDPLDVIDLSNPKSPKVCDILEMPGWVTHIDVYGDYLIALGVDNSKGDWNVAVSMFDVSDAYNAKMLDRVRLGGEYSYSTANWEPKALTTDQAHKIVIVPFQSWSGHSWNMSAGIQIVGFDMTAGKLSLKGEVRGPYPVERTRVVGDYILTASYKDVQVVDIKDMTKPKVVKTIDLCVNIIDVVPAGSHYLQMAQDWSLGGLALRTVVNVDDIEAVETVAVGSSWGHLYLSQLGIVLATDQTDGMNETGTLFLVKVDANGHISLAQIGSMPVGNAFLGIRNYYNRYYDWYDYYCPGYWYNPYNEEQMGMFGNTFVFVRPAERIYIDYQYDASTGRYMPAPMNPGTTHVYMFDLSDPAKVASPAELDLSTYQYIGMKASKGTLYLQHQYTGFTSILKENEYGPYYDIQYNYKNYAIAIDIRNPASPYVQAEFNIPGRLVGIQEGYLYSVYTDTDKGHDVLSVMSVQGNVATVVAALDLKSSYNDVTIDNGVAYLLSVKYPVWDDAKGEYIGTTETSLRTVDISVPSSPRLTSSYSFDGALSLVMAGAGHVVIYDYAKNGMLVYATGTGLTFNAMVNVQGYPEKVRLVQGTVYIPEGYYGAVAAEI